MATFLKWLLLLPVAALAVTLAIANRQETTLVFEPFGLVSDLRVTAPLFAVVFASLMAGVVLGGIGVWFGQGENRRAAREARAQAARLAAENDRLRAQQSSLVALAGPAPEGRRAA
jgi:hypothetical protein